MRQKLTLSIVAVAILGSGGCEMMHILGRNAVNEPQLATSRCREHSNDRKLAEVVWEEVVAEDAAKEHSEDYAEGFKAGFAHTLYYNGSIEAPPVPPRRYWMYRYRTPSGYRAGEDWLAGYREGHHRAVASGYRLWKTVPSSPPFAGEDGPIPLPSVAQSPISPMEELPAAPQELVPAPGKLMLPIISGTPDK